MTYPLLFLVASLITLANAGPIRVDPAAGVERPDLSGIPLWEEWWSTPENFYRLHIFVKEILPAGSDKTATLRIFTYDDDVNVPNTPAVFPIAIYEDLKYQLDDFKWAMAYKPNETSGVSFRITDNGCNNEVLMAFEVTSDMFPVLNKGYKKYNKTSGDYTMKFSIKLEEMTDKIVSREETVAATYEIGNSSQYAGVEYDETEFELTETAACKTNSHPYQNGTDKFVVQSWRHTTETPDGAVMWVTGRNDVWNHPHVASQLFFGKNSTFKFDLYVVNWRLNAFNLHRGWLTDAFYITHNPYGTFDVYKEEIDKTLSIMKPVKGGSYAKILGYGASTGAPVIANYLILEGDDSFDGFIFNSPFLAFNEECLNQFLARYGVPGLVNVGVMDEDAYLIPPAIPDDYEAMFDPVYYLGRQIVPGGSYKKGARYGPNPWSWQSHYRWPATNGFLAAVSGAFDAFACNAPLTTKPTLVLTSRGDDLLDPIVIGENSKWISAERELVLFDYNGHDTFDGMDKEDGQKAIDTVSSWLSCTFLDQGTAAYAQSRQCFTNAKIALGLKETTASKTTSWLESWLPSWLH